MEIKNEIIQEYNHLIDILNNDAIKTLYKSFLNDINYDVNKIDIQKEQIYISGILAHACISKNSYDTFVKLYNLLDKYKQYSNSKNT